MSFPPPPQTPPCVAVWNTVGNETTSTPYLHHYPCNENASRSHVEYVYICMYVCMYVCMYLSHTMGAMLYLEVCYYCFFGGGVVRSWVARTCCSTL